MQVQSVEKFPRLKEDVTQIAAVTENRSAASSSVVSRGKTLIRVVREKKGC